MLTFWLCILSSPTQGRQMSATAYICKINGLLAIISNIWKNPWNQKKTKAQAKRKTVGTWLCGIEWTTKEENFVTEKPDTWSKRDDLNRVDIVSLSRKKKQNQSTLNLIISAQWNYDAKFYPILNLIDIRRPADTHFNN